MDVLLLARLQFAITIIYHFFFVPLTLGLSLCGSYPRNNICHHRER